MTGNEIYEHLARVYIGKSEDTSPKKKKSRLKLFGQVTASALILGIIFYGLSAFLSRRNAYSSNRVTFSLSHSPIRITYNINDPYPQIKTFSIPIPKIDASRYSELRFSIRSLEDGTPGIVKITLNNKRKESAFCFIEGVNIDWKKVRIPLSEFETISDWSSLSDLSFVLEAWNAEKKKGVILIDDVSFSG